MSEQEKIVNEVMKDMNKMMSEKVSPLIRLIDSKILKEINDVNYALFGDVTGEEEKIMKILHIMRILELSGLKTQDPQYKKLAIALEKMKK